MAAGPAEPYGREGLPLDEARQRVLAAITPLDQSDTVQLSEALGRVSAEAVLATVPVPGFRASIMDGYALGQTSQPTVGDWWLLKGRSSAGLPFNGKLSDGESIRILTGAPLPEGAGWVLPQELVSVDNNRIQLSQEASDRPWIRAADEECRPGEPLLAAGQRLGPADLARLASCGVAHLNVQRKPRIGLLISGDELVPPGATRPPGTIWESNSTLPCDSGREGPGTDQIRRPRPVFLKSEHLCLSLPFLALLLHVFVLSLSCLVFVFVKIQIKSKS